MTTEQVSRNKLRAVGLVVAGVVAGGVLGATVAASAADGTPTPTPSAPGARPANPHPGDPGRPQRPAETLLTGDTAAKVRAAVLATYPGATFLRVETDGGGGYEAHIRKKDGTPATVELDKGFAVTGEEKGSGCGPDGRGPGPGPRETDLTGDTLAKVKAAVLATYPGATFGRVTTDSDGAYEADITKKDGTRTTVEVSKAFAVTGEEQHPRGPHGPGPRPGGAGGGSQPG